MTNNNLLILLLLSLLYSCSIKQQNLEEMIGYPTINIDLNGKLDFSSTPKFTDISSIVDSIWYLKLPQEPIIAEISKMLSFKDNLYILDKITNSILVIDQRGKKIVYINKKGKGPEEYASINDFTIEKETGDVIIHDNSLRKLIYYDLNGRFKKGIRVNKTYHCIEHIVGDVFIGLSYLRTSDCKLNYFTLNGDNMKTDFNYIKTSFSPLRVFQYIEDTLILHTNNLQTSYNVTKDGISSHIGFIHKDLVTQKYLISNNIDEYNRSAADELKRKVSIPLSIISKDYVYGFISHNGILYNFLTNINEDKIYFSHNFNSLGTPNHVYNFKENIFITCSEISPQLISSIKEQKNQDNLSSFFKSLEINDNPFLVFTKLK